MTVVRLIAYCELESEAERQCDFRVSEFAALDDGTEITLHSERGLSTHIPNHLPAGVWARMTHERLESSVRAVVLPDDAEETGEEHPWTWLLELLAVRGVSTTVEHLKTLPYEVRFGGRVLERLQQRS